MKNKFLFSVFVFIFISIFIALGSWQLIRLDWKNELLNKIEVSLKKEPVDLMTHVPEDYLKIKTSGTIDFERQIYLYSLNEKGVPGFNVINSILVNNENFLLNRGWIPFDKKNTQEINIFDDKIILGTLKKQTKASKFKPENDIKNNIWFSINLNDLEKFTETQFTNFVIYLENPDIKVPLPKNISIDVPNNHLKYAITWYSIAISILLYYLYFRKTK